MHLPFRNRREAGKLLAEALTGQAGRKDLLVLGLPRGGVPVAFEVAKALAAPLDILIVRKLGFPGQEELAMGAIASGGARVVNEEVTLGYGVPESIIEEVAARETRELDRREKAYRGNVPQPVFKGRCIILVDDGLATGSTMRAAVMSVRQHQPERIIVAVPVAPPDVVAALSREADEVICLAAPAGFMSVGQWYVDFSQTGDDEVRQLLSEAWKNKS